MIYSVTTNDAPQLRVWCNVCGQFHDTNTTGCPPKKITLICPVRNVTDDQQKFIDAHVTSLREQGYEIHNPIYDAPQEDITGVAICQSHLDAMRKADEVHLFWDKTSKGSHFDLGMAYALFKKLLVITSFYDDDAGKSYLKVAQTMKGKVTNEK